ncbi:RhoGAP-domain-containing protein [Paxillus ammoniavirescens]|nr:RhoGAP-domain-containing protein [Paxillus ammoniavirescens]
MAEQPGVNPLVAIENRLCPGCKRSAVNEIGGLVVAFGQSFFHVDCFKCAKCNNKVTADTNLLLLSDGSPICADCSYNCNICQQPILDEAIMTGDDSYHAHCFKCKVCHNRIDELVFAKTSHGIYCMTCHNERMAKIRRHVQRKREREKAASGSTSSSTRDREAREFLGENSVLDRSQALSPPSSVRSKASANGFRDTPSMRSLNLSIREETPTPRKRVSVSPADETPTASATKAAPPSTMTMREGQRDQRWPSAPPDAARLQSFSITVAPPDAERDSVNDGPVLVNGGSPGIALVSSGDSATSLGYLQSAPAGSSGGSHLSPLSDGSGTDILQRRKSYDDGVRPLDILFGKRSANQDGEDGIDRSSSGGLNVPSGPTSRSEKRRSINPGLTLDYKASSRPSTSSGVVSPEMVRSRTFPVQRSDSPVAPSPSKALFDLSASRRGSNASLLRDNASISTVYHSPASSPALTENGRATPDSVRMRSASHDPYPSGPQSAPSLHRSTTPLRPAPRPNVALEHVPQRSDSLSNITNTTDGLNAHGADGRLSPVGPSIRQPVHLDGLRSTTPSPLGWNGDRSGMVTPTSPSHRADVPHGIESGTDTDAEGDGGRKSEEATRTLIDAAPLPPPKEMKTKTKTKARPQDLKLDIDPDVSAISQLEGSDESSPVERTSIATFIAPALPPIRFSMSGTDFSDFLKSVGGIPSLKSLDQIAQAEEPPEKSPVSTNTLTPTSVAEGPPISVNGVSVPSSGMHTSGNSPAGDTKARSLAVPETLNVDAEANDTVSNMTREFSSRGRAASESLSPSIYGNGTDKRERLNSNASLNIIPSTTRIAITSPPDNPATSPGVSDSYDTVIRHLQESLTDANEWGSQQLKLDKAFVETILMSLVQRRKEYTDLKHRYDGTKRASQQYIDGLTVAQKEYDRELVARRNAEAEVIRLRVLLSGQAAKLTALSGENNRREARRQLSEELSKNLAQLERDLSKLKAERDVTLAEVEELCSSKSSSSIASSGELPAAHMSRSLTMRLDNIKRQYQHELVPLTQQREALAREIAELKTAREQVLGETTVLSARNEVLAQLSAQYSGRMEGARSETPTLDIRPPQEDSTLRKKSTSFDRSRSQLEPPSLLQPSLSTGSAPSTLSLVEDRDTKLVRVPKHELTDGMSTLKHGKFKWPGSRARDQSLNPSDYKGKGHLEHNFQPASVLRFTRCDHCGDKLWGGSQYRCTTCHVNVHSRCVNQVNVACSQHPSRPREDANGPIVQAPPSMFGRDLVEQVKSDLRWGERKTPVIVEKCIEAVETLAIDYEGIYRKTGGSGQTKTITQLFERGDYAAFDLRDTDRFNDICSVTSVLKTYFRSLPVPLLTYDLHEEFISAAGLKDPALKTNQLQELVDCLPSEHYHTLRLLMLHLHRVREHSDTNLMNARNLGVVFGPTLMWSRDPGSEFSDMAGKALMVEWLVENATSIFQTQQPSPH